MLDSYLPFGRPSFGPEEIEAVARVLRSGWVGSGPETRAFEEELADFLGASHVVAVNYCTSALFLSLLTRGVGPGTEVICPSLTWCSTANAALYLGADIVFCDVDAATLGVTPETVLRALSPRTRAVVPVHFGGWPCDVAGIRAALPASVAVVEDAAHAFGARFPGGPTVGASGNLTCFSFYANKNLSTADGGAIALEDPVRASRLRSLRQNGVSDDAWSRRARGPQRSPLQLAELGYKMGYTDLQASIGRVQLRRQAEFSERRTSLAREYAQRLADLDGDIGVQDGVCEPGHARHLFVVELPIEKLSADRDDIVERLQSRNIGATIHYPPLHLMPLYRGCRRGGTLDVTERLGGRILTLPIGPAMTTADAVDVAEVFAQVYRAALRPKGSG
jgi:perosamine synthetase